MEMVISTCEPVPDLSRSLFSAFWLIVTFTFIILWIQIILGLKKFTAMTHCRVLSLRSRMWSQARSILRGEKQASTQNLCRQRINAINVSTLHLFPPPSYPPWWSRAIMGPPRDRVLTQWPAHIITGVMSINKSSVKFLNLPSSSARNIKVPGISTSESTWQYWEFVSGCLWNKRPFLSVPKFEEKLRN